ncbi:Hypothetical predicted protein [Octopus vulgaris]|uniref:Uncharacterized protein n=1 Tax=Octopus vulgaris TaxID=6645 RepID=A0AA36B9G4_OCTVU|nr:Hypothetical predicted protein [Octopus vulgaris]
MLELLAGSSSLCGKMPDFRVIAVVSFLFLLCTWHQFIVDKQCTVTTSNQLKQNSMDHFEELPSDEVNENLSINKQELVHLNNYRTKYIIYYCVGEKTCGGWGDRQLGIVSVYLMALAMGRRFGIMISKPCEISAFLRPNKVNWEVDANELHSLESRYLYLIGNKEYIPLLQWADLETLYPEDVVYVTTNYDYSNALKVNVRYKEQLLWALQMSSESVFAKVMNLLFRFNNVLQIHLQNFFTVNIPRPYIQLVCAQIRIGRNPSMPGDEPRNTMSDLQIVWNFLSRYNNTSKYKIFVTTDSEEVRAIASEKFASQFVYNSGEIIHVDKPYYGKKNVCDNVMKVIMDQYILTKCDTLLVSRSYFGENAAIMRKNKKNTFIFKTGEIFAWH